MTHAFAGTKTLTAGYPAGMSRSSPAPSSETFSGLLERLTRSATTDSGALAKGNRLPARQLTPVSELKQSRKRVPEDAVSLSYEQALKTHARYRPPAKPAVAMAVPVAKVVPVPAPEPPVPPQSLRAAKTAPPRRVTPRRDVAPVRNKAAAISIKSERDPRRQPAFQPTASSATGVKGKAAVLASSAAAVNTGVSLQVQKGQILEIKRTTVSVRLSEEESERLRLRAAESGLSVSAYMRSCVLEADHLRFQVKQALAQMRARGSDPEPARLPGAVTSRGIWSRLAQSAALFLAAVYPLRRSS
jgi:hypothetical protein